MRRIPPGQGQQPTTQAQQAATQAQQFPSPGQQFPPDQAAPPSPGQRTPIRFPHPTLPMQPATSQPQASPQQNSQPAVTPPQPVPQQPQPPAGAELQPANPPRISFVGGLLTVVAENSTLADILKTVETVTHASLEGTQPDAERVFGQFGPAAPRQVLNSILSGSRYDFILVGAVDDQGSVERIMLSPHGTAPAVRGAGNQAMARQNVPTPNADDEDNDVAGQPEIQQQAAPPPPVPSEQVQPPGQQPQQQVKTPEQLLQELQRLRQQQQQQQSQQPPPGNNPH